MEKLKAYLQLLQEHKNAARTAVIIVIMIAAVLFCTLKGEKSEISDGFDGQSETGISAEGFAVEEESAGEASQSEPVKKAEFFVDIGGQVKKPGVYAVEEGARIFEVIEKAGGLTEDAEMSSVNQAEAVTDGQKIWIPSQEEAAGGAASGGQTGTYSGPGQSADGKININTADSAALQEIPGVGPATAEKIIDYRNSQGRFSSIEDIKNVSGIGEKTFEKMKDKITV